MTSHVHIDADGEVQAEAEISARGKTHKMRSPRRSLKKYHSAGNVTTGQLYYIHVCSSSHTNGRELRYGAFGGSVRMQHIYSWKQEK